ncbi:MAG: DNA methylase [Ruminococcaceae bacterium]|nr:DNA methylase [Oscillospiraceae bacterium]
MEQKQYVCIDLKSFYASVECMERGLDPMVTNLVVADVSRTEKTICLAVTPSLKAYGIPGRARLFEVIQRLKMINAERRKSAPGGRFTGASADARELRQNPSLAVDYIAAPPRMSHYIRCSTEIYQVYLKYVAPEDIHVYSIDEVFIDLTAYLQLSGMSAREFTSVMIADVLKTTGITAAAGIGTNLYLAKIAMDIEAKHAAPDKNGVRIAELDEISYRERLWAHRPLTDFWRVGHGYAKKLEEQGLYTMGDIARCSLGGAGEYYNEELLYKLFGINAELLIDHAWGIEPCTIADIKAYKPETNSISSGQVLTMPYNFEQAKLVVREMTDLLVLDLVDKHLVTDQMVLTIGYDVESLRSGNAYTGKVTTDYYGRKTPKHAHGTANLDRQTSSTKRITDAVMALYDRIVDPALLVRRINLTACRVVDEREAHRHSGMGEQLDMFTDYAEEARRQEQEDAALEREKNIQKAVLELKKKYGRNSILKGMNLQKDATARERNAQIGGHKA